VETQKEISLVSQSQCKAAAENQIEIRPEKSERIYYTLQYSVCITFYSQSLLSYTLFFHAMYNLLLNYMVATSKQNNLKVMIL